MKITVDVLKEKGACGEGIVAFTERFPEGAEYQDVLDALAAENNASWASWLMQAIGPVNTVLEVDELISEASVFFAGSIVVNRGIKVEKSLGAGGDIEAGWGIKAGRGIKAGGDVEAGECINTGWGIYAGGDVEAGRGIKAGGDVKAGNGIKAGGKIEAGWGIYAGENINADGYIEAGWGIEAGEYIEAGEDYGIYAGLGLKISRKHRAVVVAKNVPKNLLLGTFKRKEVG